MTGRAVAAATIGCGAERFVTTHATATVVGRFAEGFYVEAENRVGSRDGGPSGGRGGRDVMAVVGRTVSAGPLYLQAGERFAPPPDGAEVVLGSRGGTAAGLVVAGLVIDIEAASRYRPTVPSDGNTLDLLANLADTVPADLEMVWAEVASNVADGNLGRVRDLLCGRGRGLTPEGDDVLAGLVIVLAGLSTRRAELVSLVEAAATSDLSRAFLRWAAAGQSVEEVHDLLWAAADGEEAAFERARERVAAIGGSTGSAMLAGMRLATTFPGR